MSVKEMTAEEMAAIQNLPQEEQYVEAMVFEFCNLFASTWTDSIIQSTEGNVAYLTGLSNFINTSVDTAFDKVNGEYLLKTDDATKALYLNSVLNTTLPESAFSGATAEASFNLQSDVITVLQDVELSQSGSTTEISCETTFMNIGNTVASIKDAEVSTVYNVLGAELRSAFKKMMEDESNG